MKKGFFTLVIKSALVAFVYTAAVASLSAKEAAAPIVATNNIIATGVVMATDADKKSIKIKHDPTPAWGWPTRVMVFDVQNSVDLSGLKEGDHITFTLQAGDKGDDWVTSIKKE